MCPKMKCKACGLVDESNKYWWYSIQIKSNKFIDLCEPCLKIIQKVHYVKY